MDFSALIEAIASGEPRWAAVADAAEDAMRWKPAVVGRKPLRLSTGGAFGQTGLHSRVASVHYSHTQTHTGATTITNIYIYIYISRSHCLYVCLSIQTRTKRADNNRRSRSRQPTSLGSGSNDNGASAAHYYSSLPNSSLRRVTA